MTLPDYIKAAQPFDLANTVKHAALGLISEVGEVYGVLAKIERGDRIDRAERMTAELGDVAWFLARLCDLTNSATNGLSNDRPEWAMPETIFSATRQIWRLAHAMLVHPEDGLTPGEATQAWGYWSRLCEIEGLDPSTVLASNIAKLTDRAARKVIQGDGDHR